MKKMEDLMELARECGFSHAGPLKASTISLNPEVRKMCEANTCGMYGKNWCCPPGAGTLEECEEKLRRFEYGILVQTQGELEDELDGETMMETEAAHKEHFEEMKKKLEEQGEEIMSLGAGTCVKCKKCTYPDAPCRFPSQTFCSMEAFGMLVTEVCQKNDLPYYYGPLTITYTSCFLFK